MRATLHELREQLLNLHKALLEHQKNIFESTHGAIANPNEYFNLVVNDASFAWLRTLSALVISIDELEESSDVSPEKTEQIFSYTKKLLTASTEAAFAQQYAQAIQQDPHLASLHAQLLAGI